MTYADELRALANWIESQADLQQQYGMIGTAHILKAAEVRALADRLQGKVVVDPEVAAESGNMLWYTLPHIHLWVPRHQNAAEALQAKLDGGEG